MFSENPYVESIDDWLTVWIGDLNESELDAYLDEPGGAGDNEPISSFSTDLGRWYDHDFIWAEGADVMMPVKELCELNGIESAKLIDEIMNRSQYAEAKSLLILWNSRKIEGVNQRSFAAGRLHCVGSWMHESPLTD